MRDNQPKRMAWLGSELIDLLTLPPRPFSKRKVTEEIGRLYRND
jgi:hypothetical protein